MARTRLYEHTAENDMKYRGPISYQGFQVLGWICIVLSVVVALINLGCQLDAGIKEQLGGIADALQYVSSCSIAFLLLASFSKILNNHEGYKKQLIVNGGATAAIIIAYLLFGGRYFVGIIEKLVVQKDQVVPLLTECFRYFKPTGFLAFNIFLDMFLCTLMMFFLNVWPKKVFTGKKVLILRFLVLLPIAYELGCLYLKILSIAEEITLPLWAMPLLTVKPPMAIMLFIFIAFLVKFREYRFCRHGRTHEEYQEFMKSNRNSFHLSVHLCISMIVFALIDLILMYLLMYVSADAAGKLTEAGEIAEDAMESAASIALSLGIGNAWPLALVAPLMLLYSYNREPKRKIISLLVPAVAIVLILFIVLEAARIGVGALMAGKELDLNALKETLQQLSGLTQG